MSPKAEDGLNLHLPYDNIVAKVLSLGLRKGGARIPLPAFWEISCASSCDRTGTQHDP